MTPDTRLSRNPAVLFRSLAGETVVYNPENGQSVALDPIGALVWSCLEKPVSVLDLLPDFADAFRADRKVVERDLMELARTLAEHEFIVAAP